MLDVLHLPEEAEKNRQILGDFYGILKPIGDKIEFLMLTGISKFSQVSVFSKLNHLEDITFHRRFSTLTGLTPRKHLDNGFMLLDYLRQKGYAEKYRHDGRPVLLLGINFSRVERCVVDWKVEGL